MTTKSKPDSNFDFGKNLAELESIVGKLERGELELDEAMTQFERGAVIAEQLQKYLDRAQLKINTIKTNFDRRTAESSSSE